MSRTGLTRSLGTVFVLAYAAYHIASFGEYRRWFRPPLSLRTAHVFWPNNWKMFTHKARYHVALVFEGRDGDGEWEELPMHRWYPARWESGYRWDRPAVRRYGQIQEQFLRLACEKSGKTETRMVKLRWKKRMGRMAQPRRKVQSEILKTWACHRKARSPKGRVL